MQAIDSVPPFFPTSCVCLCALSSLRWQQMNECGGHPSIRRRTRRSCLSVPRKSLSGTNFTIAIHCVIWAGATAGAGSSVGMEESVIAIGNSARVRPSVISARDQDGAQRDPVGQDSGKARKDLKRERDDLRRGWRPHKNGGVEREGGEKRAHYLHAGGRDCGARVQGRSLRAGRKKQIRTQRERAEAVKRSCSK